VASYYNVYYSKKNVGVRGIQIDARKLAANAGNCAVLEFAALPL
jgi:hypothetical protein